MDKNVLTSVFVISVAWRKAVKYIHSESFACIWCVAKNLTDINLRSRRSWGKKLQDVFCSTPYRTRPATLILLYVYSYLLVTFLVSKFDSACSGGNLAGSSWQAWRHFFRINGGAYGEITHRAHKVERSPSDLRTAFPCYLRKMSEKLINPTSQCFNLHTI